MSKPEREEQESMRDLFDRHFLPHERSDIEWLSMQARIVDAANRKRNASPWRWHPIPAVIGVAVALAAVWWGGLSPFDRTPNPDATAARLNWEQSIFFPPEVTGASQPGDEAIYPADMRALSTMALAISAEGV